MARAAGVSMVTVSRALNTPGKLAPATLSAVRAAIEKLRYVHNLAAGSLASRRSRIVAAIVPTITSSPFSDTIDGLAQVVAPHGYQLLLGQTQYRQDEESALIAAFLGRRVDGLVLFGVKHARGVRAQLQRAGLPVVETWDLTPRPIDRVVGFSNHDAGRAAAQYLLGRGHAPLAFIGGLDERSQARMEGFRATAHERCAGAVSVVRVPSPSSVLDGSTALAKLLELPQPVRAVFCSQDMVAAGALFECQRRGVGVPGQLALMGFADLPIAASTVPALTSMQVHSKAMGQRAGEMLLRSLAGEPGVERFVDLGFAVVERGST